MKRTTRLLAALASICWFGACGTARHIPENFAIEASAAEETAPLGGAASLDRTAQMERAHRDMTHFHTTLETLYHRKDRKGHKRLSQFIDKYMGRHLDPMLRGQWQSRHPELMGLDANLRFIKADVLIRMREAGRAQRVISELEARFEGREDMLVEYPVGKQNPLSGALGLLRDSKWRG